ncbi:MAG: HEAT repeat domain-containing protein [Flavobacteriaceae bacterium]|nr:HEAT repeat domain-containing protein [Flavobacteriaceae bacterium]
MKETVFEEQAMAYLKGELDADGMKEFSTFLNDNPRYQNEFDALKLVWDEWNTTPFPEPSAGMDQRFFQTLGATIEKEQRKERTGLTAFRDLMASLWRPQLAYGLLLLTAGLAIGYLLRTDTKENIGQVEVASTSETEAVREKLVLTLLEQNSANKRLQGVNEVTKMERATKSVTDALFLTLNNDSNVNVRLAAIESLSRYVENPEVRMGLIASIVNQDSPIVQIALADLMVTLQEKESIRSMEQLLDKPNLDSTVSKKIRASIDQII